MDYKKSIAIKGNAQKAFETARELFMRQNFEVVPSGERTLELVGPGMNSTKQSPLLGISRGVLQISGNRLTLEADLGAMRWLQGFVYIFPFALVSFLSVIFFLTWNSSSQAVTAFYCYLPWLVASPLMSRMIRRRTLKTLDRLLENLSRNF